MMKGISLEIWWFQRPYFVGVGIRGYDGSLVMVGLAVITIFIRRK